MSISVRENILENIKTTIAGITTVAGYNNTFAAGTVQRFQHRGNSKAVCPCAFITAGPEDKEPGPDAFYTNKLSVGIEVYISQEEDATESSDTLLNSLLHDIFKALMSTYTRGGYARETNFRSVTPAILEDGQPYAALIIEIEVLYMHSIDNPATAG